MKAIFFFVLWLLCFPLFYLLQKDCCMTTNLTSENSQIIGTNTDRGLNKNMSTSIQSPLTFRWSSENPVTTDVWDTEKSSILSRLKDNQILQITGMYSDEEPIPTGFENMGMSRADQTRILLGLPLEKVDLKSIIGNSRQLSKTELFEAIRFDYLVKTEKIIEETIVEVDNTVNKKTTIYFPFNSTNKLNDTEVENYLDDIVRSHKASTAKISLVGHTDDRGDDQSNFRLGQARAEVVKSYLVSKGFPADRITVSSKGEASPVASNDSAEGRQKNRRTELSIQN